MSNSTINCLLMADRHRGQTKGQRGPPETVFGAVVTVADETFLFESAERLRTTLAVVDLSFSRGEGLLSLPHLFQMSGSEVDLD